MTPRHPAAAAPGVAAADVRLRIGRVVWHGEPPAGGTAAMTAALCAAVERALRLGGVGTPFGTAPNAALAAAEPRTGAGQTAGAAAAEAAVVAGIGSAVAAAVASAMRAAPGRPPSGDVAAASTDARERPRR